MKQLFQINLIFVILSALAAINEVNAHELWLEKRAEGLVLCYGHSGATHDDVAEIRYDPKEVLKVSCFDVDGQGGEISFAAQYPVTITDSCALTYVLISSGYWTKTAFGTKRLPKNEASGALESWLSFESIKRIDSWGSSLSQPVIQELELAPAENPLELETGDKIRLLVTVKGKPIAGIPVSYDDNVRGVSDEDGMINIRLKHGGRQMIRATYEEPADGIKTDKIIYTTTLMFELNE